MMRRLVSVLVVGALSATASARGARVTGTTPTTAYIDAGSADGLRPGTAWQVSIGGRSLNVRVVAVAAHDAVLELDGAPPPIGAAIELPADLKPPPPVSLRPAPAVLPPWSEPPAVLDEVKIIASRTQPPRSSDAQPALVSGELALSVFLAGDTKNTSTSWQNVALSSQLAIEAGAWRYDHVLEAQLSGSPQIFYAPLQNAQTRLDIYLLRLGYAPVGGRYAASIGRQPAATLAELGTVDGGRARLRLDPQLDIGVFAGLRPDSDLGLTRGPRAGADVGWHTSTVDGLRARADVGFALDEYRGSLDRAQTAASALIGTRSLFAHSDVTVDLASDAAGDNGPRVSHASASLRGKHRGVTASISGGYDLPFVGRALRAEIPDLVLGPRSFAGVDGRYGLRADLDVGASARTSRGDQFTSTYVDAVAMWHPPERDLEITTAPYVVVGTLLDEYGLRANVDLPPLYGWTLGTGGAIERVTANGTATWAGLGRVSGGRSFLDRWRTSLSIEAAAGDGPVRLFMFALLGYRLGQ